MRDHPEHGAVILAGMFGMRRKQNSSSTNLTAMNNVLHTMLNYSKGKNRKKGIDQALLKIFLWPYFLAPPVWDAVTHDSYLCREYSRPNVEMRPFPTQRNSSADFKVARVNRGFGNYVGAPSPGGITIQMGECPKECRPKDHQDWKLC